MQTPQVVACSKTVTIHSFQSSSPLKSYCPHRGIINCVSWNHNNKVIASSGMDGKMTLTAADNPQQSLLDLQFDQIKAVSINSCAFNSNSRYIAAGGTDSVVKVWETKSNSKEVFLNLKYHFGAVSSVCWGSFGENEILASANILGDLYLNSLKGGDVLETLTTKNQDGVNMVRISPENKLAVCTNSGSVMVWDINKPNTVMCDFKNVHKSTASAISFSSFKPALLVSVSHDQRLNFYDVNDKKPIKTVMDADEPLTSVCFYGDGHTLVLGGMHGGLFVYDLRMPSAPNGRLSGHDSTIKSIDLIHVKQNPKQNNTSSNTVSFKSASQLSGNTPHTNSQRGIGIKQQKTLTNQKSVSNLKPNPPPPSSATHRISVLPQKQQQPMVNNYIIPPKASTPTPPPPTTIPSTKNIQLMDPLPKQNSLLEMEKRLRAEMQSQFQLMHLQIIRQFQIQQKEMQYMIESVLAKQHKKDEYIRKLEQENQNLKKHSR